MNKIIASAAIVFAATGFALAGASTAFAGDGGHEVFDSCGTDNDYVSVWGDANVTYTGSGNWVVTQWPDGMYQGYPNVTEGQFNQEPCEKPVQYDTSPIPEAPAAPAPAPVQAAPAEQAPQARTSTGSSGSSGSGSTSTASGTDAVAAAPAEQAPSAEPSTTPSPEVIATTKAVEEDSEVQAFTQASTVQDVNMVLLGSVVSVTAAAAVGGTLLGMRYFSRR